MPVGSAFHARTLELCESLNYRDWAGYYAVSAYETHHEHEYNAIRNACALIDISPLYKYRVVGPGRDAARQSRDHARRVEDGGRPGLLHAVVRRGRQGDRRRHGDAVVGAGVSLDRGRSEPALVHRERVGPERRRSRTSPRTVAALALQGPTSARLLREVCDADLSTLKYFRATSGHIAGVPVDVSRTGYTGDLGYEIWMPWDAALRVWDAIAAAGRAFDLHPTGMLALDVARIEAGLLLIDVDFHSSRKALIESQKYSPYELGLGRLVDLEEGRRSSAAPRSPRK